MSTEREGDTAGGPSTPFALDDFLPYLLSVTSNRVSRLFARRYSESYGLGIAEWRVMAVAGEGRGATAGEVAARTGMDKAKVSRAVASLAARGLLRRGTTEGDRRRQPLHLSPEGARVHAGIVPLARALEAEVMAGLRPREREALRAMLAAVAARAGPAEPDGGGDAGAPD